MPEVRIETDDQVYIIQGTLIGHSTSRYGPNVTRWVELNVYRNDDGSYTVHRDNESLVYHRMGNDTCTQRSGAQSGKVVSWTALPKGALSCDTCEPPYPGELEGDDEVLYEVPRHSVKALADPDAVARDLFRARRAGTGKAFIAGRPALEVYKKCQENDEAFARRGKLTMELGGSGS